MKKQCLIKSFGGGLFLTIIDYNSQSWSTTSCLFSENKIKKKGVFFFFIMILAGYYDISSGVCPFVCTSFGDNSSYSFHRIALKLGGQFDHEVIQGILF